MTVCRESWLSQLLTGSFVPLAWAYVIVTLLFNVFWWYQFVIALGGFLRARRPPPAAPKHTFAIIVPAHNEERVVGFLVREFLAQDYPRELFQIFVSCDNCTDRTAEVAREAGAVALLRSDLERAGKQWNLQWAFEHAPIHDFDAVAIFGADDIPEPDFLRRMNDLMVADPTAEVIQGYLDSKNPDDSWVSRASALAYWYTNRFGSRRACRSGCRRSSAAPAPSSGPRVSIASAGGRAASPTTSSSRRS